jgi:hypothetical protein
MQFMNATAAGVPEMQTKLSLKVSDVMIVSDAMTTSVV